MQPPWQGLLVFEIYTVQGVWDTSETQEARRFNCAGAIS